MLIVVASGCANTKVMLVDPSRSYQPTTRVELLSDEPDRPYDVIALIETRGTNYKLTRNAIRRARAIGADAIIPVHTEREPVQFVPRVIEQDQFVVNDYGETATSRFKAIRYRSQ
jgi:DNA-directed RNA polymerase subunit K/omega